MAVSPFLNSTIILSETIRRNPFLNSSIVLFDEISRKPFLYSTIILAPEEPDGPAITNPFVNDVLPFGFPVVIRWDAPVVGFNWTPSYKVEVVRPDTSVYLIGTTSALEFTWTPQAADFPTPNSTHTLRITATDPSLTWASGISTLSIFFTPSSALLPNHDELTDCPYNFDPSADDIIYSWKPTSPGATHVAEISLNGKQTWSAMTVDQAEYFAAIALPETTRANRCFVRWAATFVGYQDPWTYSDMFSISPREIFRLEWSSGGSVEWYASKARVSADIMNDTKAHPVGGLSDKTQAPMGRLKLVDIPFQGEQMPKATVEILQNRILTGDTLAYFWLPDGTLLDGTLITFDAVPIDGSCDLYNYSGVFRT